MGFYTGVCVGICCILILIIILANKLPQNECIPPPTQASTPVTPAQSQPQPYSESPAPAPPST